MGDPGGSTSSLDDEFASLVTPCCEVLELPEEFIAFIERQRAKRPKPPGWVPLADFLTGKGHPIKATRLENHWRRHVA